MTNVILDAINNNRNGYTESRSSGKVLAGLDREVSELINFAFRKLPHAFRLVLYPKFFSYRETKHLC